MRGLRRFLLSASLLATIGGTARADQRGVTPTVPFEDFQELRLESFLNVQVTTASRHEQALLTAPSAVTVITAQEIREFGYLTLADALRGIAGMHICDDHNYEYLSVRGFASPGEYNSRILLLVDGHPMNDVMWSYAGIGTDQVVDLSVVARIEVLRGPGSALYGTAAIFGTIHVITRQPKGPARVEGAAGVGSFHERQGTLTVTTGDRSTVRALFQASAMNTDGPDLHFPSFAAKGGDGWVRQCDDDRYVRSFASVSAGPFAGRAVFTQRTKGIPTAPWDGIVGDPATESLDRVWFIDASVSHRPRANLDLSGRTYLHAARYEGAWPWDSEDSTGTIERRLDRERDDGFSLGTEGRIDWRPHRRHRILAGAELRADLYKLRFVSTVPVTGWSESTVDLNRRAHLRSSYVQEELSLDGRTTAILGCHHDHYSTFGGKLTPRAGLVREVTHGTYLKTLYGEGFRAPSYGEFYYDDGVGQPSAANLRPERNRSVELVAERTWSPYTWSRLTAQAGEVRDLIELTGLDGDGTVQYQNTGAARLRSLELEMRSRVIRGTEIRGHLTRQEVRTHAPEAWISNSPRWLSSVGLRQHLGRPGATLAIEVRSVGRRRAIHEDATVPAYVVADANLILPLPVPRWSLDLQVRNLADRTYYDPGGTEHPMPLIGQTGRTWYLRLVPAGDDRRQN